jgi:hypothetical protein
LVAENERREEGVTNVLKRPMTVFSALLPLPLLFLFLFRIMTLTLCTCGT